MSTFSQYARSNAARCRSVGCWLVFVSWIAFLPETPAGQKASHAVADLFDQKLIADNVQVTRRQMQGLNDQDRFDQLTAWILPSESHSDWRFGAIFLPASPAPVVDDIWKAIPSKKPLLTSPRVVSVVFDLLQLAVSTNRLEELKARVVAADSASEFDRRAKTAMLLMLQMQLQQQNEAQESAARLQALIRAADPHSVSDMWPETLAVIYGVQNFGAAAISNDVLMSIINLRTGPSRPLGVYRLHRHMAAVFGCYRYLQDQRSAPLHNHVRTEQWLSFPRNYSHTRGTGFPESAWHLSKDALFHVSSHEEDYLYFRSPLRGDFQIEADITDRGMNQLALGGRFIGPHGADRYSAGSFRFGSKLRPRKPPFSRFDDAIHYRGVVSGNRYTTFINGLQVSDSAQVDHSDPWIGFRCVPKSNGEFKNFRITGKPDVPDTVVLSEDPSMLGWRHYHRYAWSFWKHLRIVQGGSWIKAELSSAFAGTNCEDAFHYGRPLIEDGSFEYDFFYTPDSFHVHPALDRLVFLLQPDGVRLHWVTDAQFDRTGLAPDNVFHEQEHQRGNGDLPLVSGWNHLRLSIEGNTVSLVLNEELVFERPLEADNSRNVGLFRYADQTEVRVRNVVMKGDWPKQVPLVEDQEFVGDDFKLALIPEEDVRIFRHRFEDDGLPATIFKLPASSEPTVKVRLQDGGVYASNVKPEAWTAKDIDVNARLYGDFDIICEFDGLNFAGDDFAAIAMRVQFGADQKAYHITRMRHTSGREVLRATKTFRRNGKKVDQKPAIISSEARSGRFRLSRRDDQLHWLFAEGDSPNFRRFYSETITTEPTQPSGIILRTLAGNSSASVVWEQLDIRAERLVLNRKER